MSNRLLAIVHTTWCLTLMPGVEVGAQTTHPSPSDGAVDQVIDEVLAAYGGRDALRSIQSFRQEGLVVAANGSAHGKMYRISVCPSRLSVLVDYGDRSEHRILEDGAAWRGVTPATLVEVRGPLQGAMVLQAARTCLPGILDDLRSEAVVEESGVEHVTLSVRVAPDLVLRLFVDAESKLITRSESILEAAPSPVGFATDYSDYRPVDGVLFAFREETFASGHRTATTLLETVETNPDGARARLPVVRGR